MTGIPFHTWGADLSFLGNSCPGAIGMAEELAQPEGRMYLAGEGTHPKYNEFVRGAFLSGIDTAAAKNIGSKVAGNALLIFIISTCMFM